MATQYLRFPDEESFRSAASIAELYIAPQGNRPGWCNQYDLDHAMDIVGVIYNDDAIIDPETFEMISPATPKEGWHINFIGTLPEGWEQYLVFPIAPYRVFA